MRVSVVEGPPGSAADRFGTRVQKALGLIGNLTTQRVLPPPGPVERSPAHHPFLFCPPLCDSVKSNLPPACFDASSRSISMVDTLRPDITVQKVALTLAADPSFSADGVARMWIATPSLYDDKPNRVALTSRQLMIEWTGAVPRISSFTLARICKTNSRGGILGAHSELETIPWLQPMLDINNIAYKNIAAVGSRSAQLSFPNWSRKAPNSAASGVKTATTPNSASTVNVGHNLVLSADIASMLGFSANTGDTSTMRSPSPPRAISYKDAATASSAPAPLRSPPMSTSVSLINDGSWWGTGDSQMVVPWVPSSEVMSPSERRYLNSHVDSGALIERVRAEMREENRLALSEMRGEFVRLLEEQKQEMDMKQASDNKTLSDGLTVISEGLSTVKQGFTSLAGDLSSALDSHRQESKNSMDTLTVELHIAMLGQNRALQAAMDNQRSESRSQTASIMDAIRGLQAVPPPSAQQQPPPPVPDPLLDKASNETLYRLHSEAQISRSLRFEKPKRGSEASSFPPSQRPDVRSTPKVSQQPAALIQATLPGTGSSIEPPDTAASFFAVRERTSGAGGDDPGGSGPANN